MKLQLPNKKIFGISQGTKAQFHFYQFLFLFIIIFFNSTIYIYSQKAKIAFEHFTPEQGMSSYIAPCIIQDKEGYLWFGTYDGIDRYDGNIFTSYKNEPGNKNLIGQLGNLHICFRILRQQGLILAITYYQFVKINLVYSGLGLQMA